MAWISDARLASAVSLGGGAGLISAMNAGADYVRGEIRKCRESVGSLIFGVNIMLMSPFADDIAQLVVDEKVPLVTTGAGLPSKYMPAWTAAGIKTAPVVPSVAVAKKAAKLGASAIIAEGGESGGHVGDLTTMALVPQVADAVDIPVLAAGGVADGRGVAAAFMLGARGVQCGTRFLTATECNVHRNYKDKILAAKDIDTIVTGKSLGHPVRSLKNAFSRRFFEMEYDNTLSKEAIEAFGAGSLRKAAVEGDVTDGSVMAGQIAALVKDEAPAAEIISRIFSEAENILRGASEWIK
jgi:enoyl-[acyl-carrier protein] reductase II